MSLLGRHKVWRLSGLIHRGSAEGLKARMMGWRGGRRYLEAVWAHRFLWQASCLEAVWARVRPISVECRKKVFALQAPLFGNCLGPSL